jgi:hypothetical protein
LSSLPVHAGEGVGVGFALGLRLGVAADVVAVADGVEMTADVDGVPEPPQAATAPARTATASHGLIR